MVPWPPLESGSSVEAFRIAHNPPPSRSRNTGRPNREPSLIAAVETEDLIQFYHAFVYGLGVTVNTLLTGAGAPNATPRAFGEHPPTVTRNCPGSSLCFPSSSTSIVISGVTVNSSGLLSPGATRTRWKPMRVHNGTGTDEARSLK